MAEITWSTALLRMLRAPETPANYKFLNAWATREHKGGPALSDGSNNPFFTTAGGSSTVGPIKSGSFPYWNSIGVAKYPKLTIGVYANAYHIQTGYPNIAAALRSGNPASFANNQGFQTDLKRWSGSGYSSIAGVGAPAGPVGPTVDSAKIAKDALGSFGSSGIGSKIGDAAKGGLEKIPGVKQGEAIAGGIADVGGFLGKLTDPSNVLRGLQIVAGGALVAIGVILLARQVALAADLPDPALLAGPVGKVGKVAAGAAAASTPARREGRQIEDAASSTRPAREGVTRRTESYDANTGMTRAQAREAKAARQDRRREPDDDIPF